MVNSIAMCAHGPTISIGRFSEAGSQEWLPFVIFRKKSREVAASLPGRFLARRCFSLCITMKVEPRIAKQYKGHHCCSWKKYRGKGMEGGKSRFWAGQKIASSWKKCVLGRPIARATSYCLLLDKFWLRASKLSLNVAVSNLQIYCHRAFHCEESTHRN